MVYGIFLYTFAHVCARPPVYTCNHISKTVAVLLAKAGLASKWARISMTSESLSSSRFRYLQRPYMLSPRTLVKTGEGVAKSFIHIPRGEEAGSGRCDGFDIRISLETHL